MPSYDIHASSLHRRSATLHDQLMKCIHLPDVLKSSTAQGILLDFLQLNIRRSTLCAMEGLRPFPFPFYIANRFPYDMQRGCDFFFFFFLAQFSRKLARLYEYSYLGPVLYMNIHIAHDTKVFVTLREKKKAMKYPFPVPSPNPNHNTKSKPLHHKQLRKTMHTILPNVYRA